MEENKKNSNIIIVILLAIIIAGLLGFIVYDKFIKKEPEENLPTEPVLENNENKFEEERKLVNLYRYQDLDGSLFDKNKLDEETKIKIAFMNSTSTEVDCKAIYENNTAASYIIEKDEEDDSIIGYEILDKNEKRLGFCDIYEDNGISYSVKYEDLNKTYKLLFGSELNASKTDFGNITYESKNDLYILLSCRCGGVSGVVSVYDVISSSTKDNKLIVKVWYTNLSSEDDEKYCSSDNKDLCFELEGIENNVTEYYKGKTNNLPTRTFTFVKENNNYVLEKYE